MVEEKEGADHLSILTTTLVTLVLRFGYAGWGILLSVLLARWLGTQEYGVYVYIMALVSLLNVFAGVGLPTLLVKEISAYRANGEVGLLRGIVAISVAITFLTATVVGLLAAIVGWTLGDTYVRNTIAANWLLIVGLTLVATLSVVRSSILRGLKRIILAQVPEVVVAPVVFLTVAAGIILANGMKPTAGLALEMQFVSFAAAFAVGTFYVIKNLPPAIPEWPDTDEFKRWIRTALPFLFVGGAQIMNAKIDVMMVGSIVGSGAAGMYQIASKGAEILVFVYLAFGTVVGPRISELQARNDTAAIQKLVTSVSQWLNVGSVTVGTLLIVLGPWLLETVFGLQYADAYFSLALLSGFRLVFSLFGLCDLTLQMLGAGSVVAKTLATATGANVVLNAVLIPLYGIEGAAVATGLTLTAWNVYLSFYLKKNFGITTFLFG